MKYLNKFTQFSFVALFFISCQQEDVFDVPNALGAEENTQLTALLEDVESGERSMLSKDMWFPRMLPEIFIRNSIYKMTQQLLQKRFAC